MALVIAFGSGLFMGFAPAPLNAFPLAWVALIPLWVLEFGHESRKRNFFAGVLNPLAWGLGYHGLALSWITGLHPLTWLGIPWLVSVTIAYGCWLFITLWGAALVVIWTVLIRRYEAWVLKGQLQHSIQASVIRVLVGTTIWCGLEWVWSLGSLYWTSLSYTQSPGNLVILHLGQVAGPAMVTAAIVAINGLLAEAWIHHRLRVNRLIHAEPVLRSGLFWSAAAILILSHLVGYALYSHPLEQPIESALKVGVIQGNVPTRIKHTAEGRQRSLQGYVMGYQQLADEGTAAVLTPEGALPFLWDGHSYSQNPFYQAVLDRGSVGWLGTFVRDDDRITQSLLTLTGTGEVVGRYNKIKLVPLGEYIPFREVLGGLIARLSPVEADMQPGTAGQQFDTPFGRAIASICYDSAFPEVFRSQAATGGQFILTASNLDPYSEVLMAQHQAQDVMRAIETDRWAVRATNTGYSGILDPHGRVQWRSQPRTYAIHAATIYRQQTQTLYVRWGDWFTPLLAGVAAIVSVGLKITGARRRTPS